jgi:hypothetical protein
VAANGDAVAVNGLGVGEAKEAGWPKESGPGPAGTGADGGGLAASSDGDGEGDADNNGRSVASDDSGMAGTTTGELAA